MDISTNGRQLDLQKGFSMAIEDSNPIFNERGSQSVPATVPPTPRNLLALDFATRVDAGRDPNLPEREARVTDGAYIRTGAINVTGASPEEGITFNIGFDNSTAYMAWEKSKLADLEGFKQPLMGWSSVDMVLSQLYSIYKGCNPQEIPVAVFPIAVAKETTESGQQTHTKWEILNQPYGNSLEQPTKITRKINDVETELTVPRGYMVTPFLRVWKVLEMAFGQLGLSIEENPFQEDPELARLVVLNNAADSCCLGSIITADLLPDCTVGDFMQALWVRFGLVYNIDYNKRNVSLRFIKDIIRDVSAGELSSVLTGYPKIIYNERRYVKLTAQSSIEGAAPATERFEDFTRGLDLSDIHYGRSVSSWINKGTPSDPKWDGDVGYIEDDYPDPDDPDYPDPPDPWEQDEPDFDYDYMTRSGAHAQKASARSLASNTFLAREFVSGMWYALDAINSKVMKQSTGFFNWDPATDGLDAMELSSPDEWVPIVRVNSTQAAIASLMPGYLCGLRHYHSYIKGADNQEEGETPLAFMFAYTQNQKTIGRFCPEDIDGQRMVLDDGSKPSISLLFQFTDGLFAKFWKGYDEILRHASRQVEAKAMMPTTGLLALDILKPVTLDTVRFLPDTLSYSLPARGPLVEVELRLQAIQTQGDYDIDEEQAIPDVAAVQRSLVWRAKSDDFSSLGDSQQVRSDALQDFLQAYEPHTEGKYTYFVNENSFIYMGVERITSWQNDIRLPTPQAAGQRLTKTYKARLDYQVHEQRSYTGADGELITESMGTVYDTYVAVVDYEVVLVARYAVQ